MEGPSLYILKEELAPFRGQKVLSVDGNTKQPLKSLQGRKLQEIMTWGKVLLLTFAAPRKSTPPVVVRTHFLMWGSYRIDDPRPNRIPRLQLTFKNGVVYFYSCSMKFGEPQEFALLDSRVDLMSDGWDIGFVVKQIRRRKDTYLCDLLLDQTIFAGSGNIVKNEVLFNIRRHPLSTLSQVASADWKRLAKAVHEYCWNFYEWKKSFELRQHWQVYAQSKCPLCGTKLIRKHLGHLNRRTFYCPKHQLKGSRNGKLYVFPVLPLKIPTISEGKIDH